MDDAWPWLAVAAFGALHGLNPLGGWPAVAACGRRHDGRGSALRALLSLAAGHLLSVLLVAAAVATGLALPRALLPWLAGAVLLLVLAWRWAGRRSTALPAAGLAQTALGLWSFIVSTFQGAGLMLVPALAPLCLSGLPDRAAGSAGAMGLALAAAGLHMVAMLGAAAVMAMAARCAARRYGATRARRTAVAADAMPTARPAA